jgi:hypothetical protein
MLLNMTVSATGLFPVSGSPALKSAVTTLATAAASSALASASSAATAASTVAQIGAIATSFSSNTDGSVAITSPTKAAVVGPQNPGTFVQSAFMRNSALELFGGQTTRQYGYGWANTACAESLTMNIANQSAQAQVMGGFIATDWTNASGGPTSYGSRDSVVSIRQIVAPHVPFSTANGPAGKTGVGTPGTFTANTFIPTTPMVLSGGVNFLAVNMLIDTNDSTKATGAITGWDLDADGHVTVVHVNGWWTSPATAGTAPITPSGTIAYINPVTKTWVDNGIISLDANSFATHACGYELDISNNTGSYDVASQTPLMVGFDTINMGNATVSVGYRTRITSSTAPFQYGFQSNGATGAGFFYMDPFNVNGAAFYSKAAAGVLLMAFTDDIGHRVRLDTRQGNLELGAQGNGTTTTGVTSTPYIDFHTTGNARDYDARIVPLGGDPANDGKATLKFIADSVMITGPLKVPAYSVGALPDPTQYASAIIHIQDSTTSKRLAVSDGVHWKWSDDSTNVTT